MLLELLSKHSKIDAGKLRNIAADADNRYKVYNIKKRTGGWREIHHPSQELKALQRWIVRVVVSRFPVHQAATAYRIGSGVKENAERHRHTNYTNRYDFSSFFPSFRQHLVEEFVQIEAAKVGMALTENDLEFVGNIVCRYGRLTIGAPSSPALTNSMMFDFDKQLNEYCDNKELIYTRYADDIFISSMKKGKLQNLEKEIRKIKHQIPHISLRLKHSKTAYLSKKHTRRITGVIITPQHELSVGRERKREIKAMIHRWLNGKLSPEEVHRMRGLVAFARDIEPSFEQRLIKKYGPSTISTILHSPSLTADPNLGFGSIF